MSLDLGLWYPSYSAHDNIGYFDDFIENKNWYFELHDLDDIGSIEFKGQKIQPMYE